jgi:predicted short-subunit dehydrogenase-like oxidoreductase (DUF2520 family)
VKIGLIGCGKVGTTLFYLLKKNNQITGVYDINKKNQRRTAKLLHIKKNPSLEELCIRSEALFFATPDDQIIKVYKKAKSFIKKNTYIYHLSGLLSSKIFPKSRYVYRASVHPFATFSKIKIPPTRNKYFIFVEGDRAALMVARKIFRKKYFMLKNISRQNKTFYHLLGVFSSNFLVGLMAANKELAKKIGWQEKDLLNITSPIILETLINIVNNGIVRALSGPLERGDIETIKKHLNILKKDKNLLNIYKSMSSYILKNLPRVEKRKEIEKLLSHSTSEYEC